MFFEKDVFESGWFVSETSASDFESGTGFLPVPAVVLPERIRLPYPSAENRIYVCTSTTFVLPDPDIQKWDPDRRKIDLKGV